MLKKIKGMSKRAIVMLVCVLMIGVIMPQSVFANEIDYHALINGKSELSSDHHEMIIKNLAIGETNFSIMADEYLGSLKPKMFGTYFESVFNGGTVYKGKMSNGKIRTRYELGTRFEKPEHEILMIDTMKDILDIIIKPGSTDAQKVEAIVHWLSNNITYGDSDPDTVSPHAAFRIISHQEGYCQVYASLFQLMADIEGLDSVYMIGMGNGELHGWNMVKLNGKWVGVDATWHREGDPFYFTDMNEFGQYRTLPENLDAVAEEMLDNVKLFRKHDPKIK